MFMLRCSALVFVAMLVIGTSEAGKTESEAERTKITPPDRMQAVQDPSLFAPRMFSSGDTGGDFTMGTTDDGCEKFDYGIGISYFGLSYSSLWVCNNGIVTFDGSLSWYTPVPMSSPSQNKMIIAVYWADIDTRYGVGTVYYGKHTSGPALLRGKNLVNRALPGISNFNPKIVIVITWYKCTFFGANYLGKTKLNTFQLVLVSDGPRTFGFKTYDRLQWTTGTASGGSASTGLGGTAAGMGFSNSYSSFQWYQVPGFSFTSNALHMTEVNNIHAPYVSEWKGNWLDQYNLIGNDLGPIMTCLREQTCCVMQGYQYQPEPITECTRFKRWRYLNNANPSPIVDDDCVAGQRFDVFPTTCRCNWKCNVDKHTCMSTL